jgi:hypothetical protein
MRRISITVPLKGISTGKAAITTDATGFQGETCKTATDAILKSLGGQQDETLKPEYYQQDQAIERITDGGASPQ